MSEATVAKLAAHGSTEQALQLLEALAADARGERTVGAGLGGGAPGGLPARAQSAQTQLEAEVARRLMAAD